MSRSLQADVYVIVSLASVKGRTKTPRTLHDETPQPCQGRRQDLCRFQYKSTGLTVTTHSQNDLGVPYLRPKTSLPSVSMEPSVETVEECGRG